MVGTQHGIWELLSLSADKIREAGTPINVLPYLCCPLICQTLLFCIREKKTLDWWLGLREEQRKREDMGPVVI